MRDHQKLVAFQKADELVLMVYSATKGFPAEELYGLRAQIRRAAVSVPSNLVEGCARDSEKEFLHFCDIAFGSLRELGYQLSLAGRLNFLHMAHLDEITPVLTETEKILGALIRTVRAKVVKSSGR